MRAMEPGKRSLAHELSGCLGDGSMTAWYLLSPSLLIPPTTHSTPSPPPPDFPELDYLHSSRKIGHDFKPVAAATWRWSAGLMVNLVLTEVPQNGTEC